VTAIRLGRTLLTGSVPPTRQLREPHQRWPTWCCCAQRLPVSPVAGFARHGCCSVRACARVPALAGTTSFRWCLTDHPNGPASTRLCCS